MVVVSEVVEVEGGDSLKSKGRRTYKGVSNIVPLFEITGFPAPFPLELISSLRSPLFGKQAPDNVLFILTFRAFEDVLCGKSIST